MGDAQFLKPGREVRVGRQPHSSVQLLMPGWHLQLTVLLLVVVVVVGAVGLLRRLLLVVVVRV